MTQLYNAQRQAVDLGAEVGRGGEASVYKLAVQPSLLAKVYHRPPRSDYELKLAWMQANPPIDPTRFQGHASIAWPYDLLYDAAGQLAGYVMVYVQNAVPLLQVFNPRLRAKTLPTFNRRYLHRAARNLAAALNALHASNYVVGDLNESNVMVTPSALVTIIDADSFQVQRRVGAKPYLHPCPVGKPEYTPPELQGKTFSETARLPEHDRFGLAVLVFQLLMEGNHPFRAQWLGAGDPPPVDDRIRDGHWPYGAHTGVPISSPRGAPNLELLHPDVAALFRRCFVDGHQDPGRRPEPDEWERVIIRAEKALTVCTHNHLYSKHLKQCPECQAVAARSNASAQTATPPPPASAPSRPAWRTAWPARAGGPAGGAPAQAAPLLPLAWSFLWPRLRALIARPSAPSVVRCRHCRRLNSMDEVYCQGCARRLGGQTRCASCRRRVPFNARYCPRCGARQ